MCNLWLSLSFVCLMPYLLLFIGFKKVSSWQFYGITCIWSYKDIPPHVLLLFQREAGSRKFWFVMLIMTQHKSLFIISNCLEEHRLSLCVATRMTERESLDCSSQKHHVLLYFIFCPTYTLAVSPSVLSSCVLAFLISSSTYCHFVALWKGDHFRQTHICPIRDF